VSGREGTAILVTKLEAAQRQLRTALNLWFQDGDPVSIHTLLSAAHEIVHRLYRNKGLVNLIFDSDLINEEYRGSFAKLIKQAPNFFKHANRDDELGASFTFNPETNDLLPGFLIQALRDMEENLGLEELAYVYWMSLHKPNLFQSGHGTFPVDAVKELVGVNKEEFFGACKLLWSQGQLRNFLVPRPPVLKGR
jgi:hypothetical protein